MKPLTHVDERGQARMVDVSGKAVTVREASAAGRVLCSPAVIELLRGDGVPKGDALAVARLAGIQAAKRTPDLVPLAHPVAVHAVTVELEVADDGVEITATVRTADRTGVEMEALTCVTVARWRSWTWSRRSTSGRRSPTSGSRPRAADDRGTGGRA